MKISEIDQKTAQGFVAEITPGHSGKHVENIVLTLSGILRHVRRWGWRAPAVSIADLSMPPKIKARPQFYEVSEIKRLIAAAPEPLKTILIVLVMTGLRINECLALRLADFDFERKIISVQHSAYNGQLTTPKTEASVADLHMQPELEKAVRQFIASNRYRKNPLGLLFCNRRNRPYSDNKAREDMLGPLLRELRMHEPRKAFHAIRHTAGSVMLQAGASIAIVSKQLRHSNPSVTLNVYSHVLGNAQRDAANTLGRLVACPA
jgi:integrase